MADSAASNDTLRGVGGWCWQRGDTRSGRAATAKTIECILGVCNKRLGGDRASSSCCAPLQQSTCGCHGKGVSIMARHQARLLRHVVGRLRLPSHRDDAPPTRPVCHLPYHCTAPPALALPYYPHRRHDARLLGARPSPSLLGARVALSAASSSQPWMPPPPPSHLACAREHSVPSIKHHSP